MFIVIKNNMYIQHKTSYVNIGKNTSINRLKIKLHTLIKQINW